MKGSGNVGTVKILMVSSHFPPDFGAGGFRSFAIFKAFEKEFCANVTMCVCTSEPSRYVSRRIEISSEDPRIKRSKVLLRFLPNKLLQIINFLLYALNSTRNAARFKPDIIFVTSGRLGSGIIGYIIKRIHKDSYFVLDVRDLFGLTVSGYIPKLLCLPILWLERTVYGSADLISLTSLGFVDYDPVARASAIKVEATNGIDELFVEQSSNSSPILCQPGGARTIVYAGNIGYAQALHKILPVLASIAGERINFHIYGTGNALKLLLNELERASIRNVEVFAPVNRSELPGLYAKADGLLLTLDDLEAYETVIPSKVFEYAASGKPIFAVVRGYPANFIRSNIPGSWVFSSLQLYSCVQAILKVDGTSYAGYRKDFVALFSRRFICRKLVSTIRDEYLIARSAQGRRRDRVSSNNA